MIVNFKEYVDYNGGPGVQHIALRTDNIIKSVILIIYHNSDYKFQI